MVRLSANHVGKSVLGSGGVLSQITQGNYWLLASGASLETDAQTISIDVDNLLDSAANSFAFGIPTFRFDDRDRTPLRPRIIRIGIRRSF